MEISFALHLCKLDILISTYEGLTPQMSRRERRNWYFSFPLNFSAWHLRSQPLILYKDVQMWQSDELRQFYKRQIFFEFLVENWFWVHFEPIKKVSNEKLCSDKTCFSELFSAINILEWSEMHQKLFTDRNFKKYAVMSPLWMNDSS